MSEQKDPTYFAEVVANVRERDARFVWIGAGDSRSVEILTNTGAEVTGWLSRSHANVVLQSADAYIHTASWEGFPISLIEAHDRGLPIIVRRIPAFDHLPEHLSARTPAEMNAKIEAIRVDPEIARTNRESWAEQLRNNTLEGQREALRAVYEGALSD